MARFACIEHNGAPVAALAVGESHWAPIDALGGPPISLEDLIASEPSPDRIRDWQARVQALGAERLVAAETARFLPPLRRPHKIWNIGFNYARYASTYAEAAPEMPASFMKGDHTIVAHGGEIVLPAQSRDVTAEAELALVIGRKCRDVSEEEALGYVFGVCAVLDQTAADILRQNPRYLTVAKNFETFLALGLVVMTLDEFTETTPLSSVLISTLRNGETLAEAPVSAMTHSPQSLISFHSKVMPLFAGDVICTGSPGAAPLADGDAIEARVGSLPPLRVGVRDGARHAG